MLVFSQLRNLFATYFFYPLQELGFPGDALNCLCLRVR